MSYHSNICVSQYEREYKNIIIKFLKLPRKPAYKFVVRDHVTWIYTAILYIQTTLK